MGAIIDIRKVAEELVTLRDLIRWGTSQFNAAQLGFFQGMPTAIDEAVYLCLSALHLPPDFSDDYFDCVLTMDERLHVLDLFQQRIEKRKPAAYITNEAWFCGLNFYVDERVLIPRSPMAELIQRQFSPWISADRVYNVLDLCTGSGCIAIACAYAFEQSRVDASDISTDALAVAKINRQNHGLEDRLELIESDLFDSIPDIRGSDTLSSDAQSTDVRDSNQAYDIIISNPPYVSEPEMKQLPAEFDHEPGALALVAGETGMDIVLKILNEAGKFLAQDGILVVEVGYSKPALENILPSVPFMWVDFEFGGEGVFVLTAEQLEAYQTDFRRVNI